MMYFIYDDDTYVDLFTSIVEGREMIRKIIEDSKGQKVPTLVRSSATKEEIEAVEAIPKQEHNAYWGIEEEEEDTPPDEYEYSDDDYYDDDDEYFE